MIESYAWARGREAMVRMGPADGPTILILPPLFEDANRMRRILAQVMRELAEHGFESVLPDIPGTNDSIVATVDTRWNDWAAAVSALAATLPRPLLTVAIRGGVLLDGFAQPDARWRLSPENGKRLLRDMLRATALTSGLKASELEMKARAEPTMLAGNLIHPDLFVALDAAAAESVEARTAAIGQTAQDVDIMFAGSPPWRCAEPQDDPGLVAAMVDDIAAWARTCATR